MLNTKLIAQSLLLLTFCSSILAEEHVICGWIDHFDGPLDAYTVIRNGKEHKISVFMPLYPNDQITVNDEYMLRIGRPDGSHFVVKKHHQTITLAPIENETDVLDNLIEWASEWFGSNVLVSEEEQVVSLAIRGNNYYPLRMPLAPFGKSRLISGDRLFYLSWEGGTPPFQVDLASEKNGQIFVINSLDSRNISAVPVLLEEGRYRLVVRDSTQELATNLEVVSAVVQPSGHNVLDRVVLPEEVESTLRAAWLASHESREWMLEAYQKVSPLAEFYRPAMLLRDQLQRSNYPSR